MEFNDLLREAEIDPSDVRLLRHQTKPGKGGISLFDLWREDRTGFELYQSTQKRRRPLFRTGRYWASFASDGPGSTVFTGLYEATLEDTRKVEWQCPYRGGEVGKGDSVDVFKTVPCSALAEHIGKLHVEWNIKSVRHWARYAARTSISIVGDVFCAQS